MWLSLYFGTITFSWWFGLLAIIIDMCVGGNLIKIVKGLK